MMSRIIIFLLVVVSHGVSFVTADQSSVSSWMDEQIDNWKTLIEWKDLIEQRCDVSDAEEYWRSLFKCPNYSHIKCLAESSVYVEIGRLNCTFITCGDGRYTCSDKKIIQEIYRQQFDDYKKLMAFYKKEMADCKPRLCSVTAGDSSTFTTAATTPNEFTETGDSSTHHNVVMATDSTTTVKLEEVTTPPTTITVGETDYDGGNWTVFQRRQDGSVDFYQSWTEYENGFGDLEGEFWLGLAAIHELTKNEDHELLVEMITIEGTSLYARYSNFSVGSSLTNYTLTVGGYSGNATDGMANPPLGMAGSANQQQFTTYDVDNDKYWGNCAHSFKGGWWYNSCYHANLNGLYQSSVRDERVAWTNQDVRTNMIMRFTEMKTRKSMS